MAIFVHLSLAGEYGVVGGTAWVWSKEELARSVDVLVVDEAGQLSLANVLACAQGAKNLVMLGDPQQLEQPQKASHPEGSELSEVPPRPLGAKGGPRGGK